MDFSDKTACISPVRMSKKSRFKFECHSGVDCFTLCCRGINVTLTPYDIIQLKNRLDLTSRDFLTIYTHPHLLEKTDLPMITLKLLDDEFESCPFVKDGKGCIIYEDRPTSCRYYPLGSATVQYEKTNDSGFYFFVNESHCKGFAEEKEWLVEEWCKSQGVDDRDIINAEWTDLVVRKRSFPANIKLTEQAKRMFFLVSYDIDKFREFVFETSFLKRFKINKVIENTISKNEVELLKFGLIWLKGILFKNENSEQATSKAI